MTKITSTETLGNTPRIIYKKFRPTHTDLDLMEMRYAEDDDVQALLYWYRYQTTKGRNFL